MSQEMVPALVPAWDLADRLRKALRHADVGVQEMADYLGVERNTVGRYINGRTGPDHRTLRLWSLRCGVPLVWLRNGASDDPDGGGSVRHQGLEPRTR